MHASHQDLRVGAFLALSALLVSPARVHANGLELSPGGTRALGRGGAVAARPVDPMAMLHNPAGLPRLSGDQLMVNLDLSLHDMCFEPYGYYGWGVYPLIGVDPVSEFGDSTSSQYSERELDSVCNSAPSVPIPQLAWTFHATEDLSFGLGFVAPSLVTGLQYGNKNGTLETDDGLRPTPTRYQMIHQEVEFGLNPSLSVAYRIMDALSVGVTFQVAMAKASAYAMMTENAGTSPHDDLLAKLTVEDYFVPGAIISVHSEPIPGLSFMAGLRVYDDFSGPGELTATTNYYHVYSEGEHGDDPAPFRNAPAKLDNVTVGAPWSVTAAVRYAYLLPGAADKLGKPGGDPLATELWDVELDFTYNLNERGGGNQVSFGDDLVLFSRRGDGTPSSGVLVPEEDIPDSTGASNVIDSMAVRLGGSFNPIPDTLGFSAGAFYETRATEPAFATIESFAFQRVGLGIGAVVRLGSFDLMASYAHIFSEEMRVAPPPHQPRDEAQEDDPTTGFDKRLYMGGELSDEPVLDPDAPDPGSADGVAQVEQAALVETATRQARVVNAGRYSAAFDVLSIGFVYRY